MINEIGQLFVGLGVLINSIIALMSYIQTKKSAKLIKTLEQNTNSIKDELVRVTGESEHAKGVLQGTATGLKEGREEKR